MNDVQLLKGKVIVITGAGRGLGAGYAKLAAAHGASVVVNDIDMDEAHGTVRAIREQNGVALANGEDIGDPGGAASLVDAAVGEFGSLYGLVNNAGVIEFGPAWDETPAAMRHQVDVNVLGTLYTGLYAMRHMRTAGSGVILNVCSGAAAGMEGRATYCATKGAIAALTYAWAIDLKSTGVRVNAVAPVGETRMHAASGAKPGQGTDPAAIAPLVVYMLSDQSEWIRGQIIRLTGLQLSVMSRPTNVGVILHAAGWSIADIDAALRTEMRSHLSDSL